MSSAKNTVYICGKCGAQSSKWSGRCFECGTWGTLASDVKDGLAPREEAAAAPAKLIDLRDIKTGDGPRYMTGIGELDRVSGGGIVPGSIILLAGEPGVGKSTLLSQLSFLVKAGGANVPVMYVSGEESAAQVKLRFNRLDGDLGKVRFVSETNIERIISAIKKEKPNLVVVDSIQTVYSISSQSEPGSIAQIRAAAVSLLEAAKTTDTAIIVTGHITKDGQVAGPKTLEHIVDTVIYLESEFKGNYRILRATKNRFGSVNEIGVFEMTSKGFKEIKSPSAIFLETGDEAIAGSAVSVMMEGTRPFMIEVQALASKTVFGYPQRKASGYDANRLQLLIAVLNKRAGMKLMNQDVILNVVGGFKVADPGLDLAVCAAIISSLANAPISKKTVIIGEVGLGGEIRGISQAGGRLKEAAKLGFDKAVMPKAGGVKQENMAIINLAKVSELKDNILK